MTFGKILFSGLLILGLSYQAHASQSVETHPRRFIFLIHGINGSLKTFGALPQVLKAHGSQVQPDYDISVIPLKYATGKSFSTYDFAHDVSRQMLEHIGTLRPTDRINIVAHSQGGLISWIWYLLSYGKEEGFEEYFQLASQTESLMTLGSPMWGSKMASFLRDHPSLTKIVKGENWGKSELEEMGYSSDTIYRFRRRSVGLDQENFKLPIRVMAVAGVLTPQKDRQAKWYHRPLLGLAEAYLGAGSNFQVESDMAVDVSSARVDFIYLKKNTNHLTHIRAEDFTHFNEKALNNFTVVRGPHLSWSQEAFFDIAEVPAECINLNQPCTHQTYPLILKFTMACTEEIKNCNQPLLDSYISAFTEMNKKSVKNLATNLNIRQMRSFILDLVLDLHPRYSLPKDKNEILSYLQFPTREGSRIYTADRKFYFLIDRTGELRSNTTRISEKYHQIRATLHGHIFHNFEKTDARAELYEEFATNGFKLPLIVNLPGQQPREVEVLVKPTYTTFINLDYK